ncbi:hypothetical protein ABFS83_01G075700 [Erythranthe nasuta]
MATQSLSFLIFIAFIIFAPDIRSIRMINGRSRNPPIGQKTRTSLNDLLENKAMQTIKDTERPPPRYTCVSILGVCGLTCTEQQCKSWCIDYFGTLNPWAHCDEFPGVDAKFCYCEHWCMIASSPPSLH